MTGDFDLTAAVRSCIKSIAFGSPKLFMLFVAIGIVLQFIFGVSSVLMPDDRFFAALASYNALPYAVSWIVMYVVSWRVRSDLNEEDEKFMQLISVIIKKAELSGPETRQYFRDLLRIELENVETHQ